MRNPQETQAPAATIWALRPAALPLELRPKYNYSTRQVMLATPSGRPLVKLLGSEAFFQYLDRFHRGRQAWFEAWVQELFLFVSLPRTEETSAPVLRGHLTRLHQLSMSVSESEMRAARGQCKNLPLRAYMRKFFDGNQHTFCEWLDDLFLYLAIDLPYAEDLTRSQRYHASRVYHLLEALEQFELDDALTTA